MYATLSPVDHACVTLALASTFSVEPARWMNVSPEAVVTRAA